MFPHRSRLAACMADELRNPPCLIGSGSGRWAAGRQGNWPDTPTSGIHSTFLLNPVLTPLLFHPFLPHPPSSSSTAGPQIFHCPPLPPAEWTRCKSDKCSSRVGRIVLPLLVFPLFYPESCVLCGPRQIPTCHGSTTRWGRSFGESLGSVWDTRAGGM